MPLKLSRFFNPNLDKCPSNSNAGDECRLETSSLTSSHNSHQSAPGFIPTMFARRLLMTKRTDDARLSRSKSALGTKAQKSPKKKNRVGLKEKYEWDEGCHMMKDEIHEELTKHESTPANDTLPVQSQRPRGPNSNNSQPLYHPVTGPLVGCPGYAWDPYQQTWIYTMPYGQPYSGPGWAPPKKAFQTLYPQVQGPADCTGQGWRTPQKIQGPSVLKPTTYYYPTAIQMGHRHSYNQLIVDARPAQMVSSLTYRVSTSNITYKQTSYYGQSWKPPQVPPGANKPRFSRQRPTIRTKHASGSPVSQYNPSTFQLHQAGQMYQEQLHSSSFTNAKHFQQPSADILRKKATPFYEGPPLSGIPDHDISPLLIGVNRTHDSHCSRESLDEPHVQELPPNEAEVCSHHPPTDKKEVKIEETLIEQLADEVNRAQPILDHKNVVDHEAVIEQADIEAKQDLSFDKPHATLLEVATSPSITQGTFSTSASEAPDTASNVDQLDVTIVTPISPLSQAAESQAPFFNEDEQQLETKDGEEEEWQYQRHQRRKMKNNFKMEPSPKPKDNKPVIKNIDDEVSEPGESTQGHDALISIGLENGQLDNVSSHSEDANEGVETEDTIAHQDLTTLKKSKGQKKRARAKAKKLEADEADNRDGNSSRQQKR
ncbi:hypothetical protein LQV05_006750 [Cryptococcus neoformans]|nr:hypothetical protein LQV05_006750 [Cryptococcus neoformans]